MRWWLVVAAVAVAAAAGGWSPGGSGGLPDATLMLRDASARGRSVKSAHIEMAITGNIAPLGFSRLEVDAVRGVGAQGVVVLLTDPGRVDFIDTKGHLRLRTSEGSFVPASKRIAAKMPSTSALLDPDRGIGGSMMSKLQNAKTVAKDRIDGIEVFKVTGTLPPNALPEVLSVVHSDAAFVTWLRVRAPHVPLENRLVFSGDGAVVQFEVSKSNEPVAMGQPR